MFLVFHTELIESIMYLYRATKDPILLEMGRDIYTSIETSSKTSCGYTTVSFTRTGVRVGGWKGKGIGNIERE